MKILITFLFLLAETFFFSRVIYSQGLREVYKNFFPVGASVGPGNLHGEDSLLLISQFNSITAENIMKMGPVHPLENDFNWGPADELMTFASKHQMLVRGHTLVWHRQAPSWLFAASGNDALTADLLMERMRDHIYAVVGRYRGQIYAWDVVNEVISDNKNEFYRSSEWYQICGPEFIKKAFRYAHEADPDALLFYNDYNTVNPDKRRKIIEMVSAMKAEGIPIHGIGMQGHWNIRYPSEEQLRQALDDFVALNLDIQITELDVSIYTSEKDYSENPSLAREAFTKTVEELQAEQYAMIFRVLREYKRHITGVTFWNVTDRKSWLDNFPVRGRKNFPLLFDENGQPKAAYYKVIDF